MSQAPLIFMVGMRSDAVRTALRLGLRVAVWAEKRPPRSLLSRLEYLSLGPIPETPDRLPAEVTEAAKRLRPDAVGAVTERAVLPAALLREHLGLAGVPHAALVACRDKRLMKEKARAAGIPVTDWAAAGPSTDGAELGRTLGFPLVLKRLASSGSRGLKVLRSSAELRGLRIEEGTLAERFIQGKEWSVEAFVHGGEPRFFNVTEYYAPLTVNLVPGRIPEADRARIVALARQAVRAFDVERGMIHMEAFVRPDGVTFGEMAVRPPGGYLMPLIQEAYGFDPWEAWVRAEMGHHFDYPAKASTRAAVVILHPGEGNVKAIHGVEVVKSLPETRELSLKIEIGDDVAVRLGSGMDVGRLILSSTSDERLLGSLELSLRELRFEMA